jgi:hypothetical protein
MTLEIPEALFRQAKASAALRGKSLGDFIVAALEAHLERQAGGGSSQRGWRSAFGQARREDVEPIDALLAEEFERVEDHLDDLEDLRLGLDRLQDPTDPILDWQQVRSDLLAQN